MDVAYNYLPTETKHCVGYVGTFPGSFDAEAGTAILNACEVKGQECLETLERHSLIERYILGSESQTELRYRLHTLIREYFNLSTPQRRFCCGTFLSSFASHYITEFLELYNVSIKGNDFIVHKLAVDNHNLQYLLKIVLLHEQQLPCHYRFIKRYIVKPSMKNKEAAAVVAFAYSNEQIEFDKTGVNEDLFSALSIHQEFFRTVLSESKYDFLYADLLGKLYEFKCKMWDHHQYCRCTEICEVAFTMWMSHNGSLSIETCFSCSSLLILRRIRTIFFFMTFFTVLYCILCFAALVFIICLCLYVTALFTHKSIFSALVFSAHLFKQEIICYANYVILSPAVLFCLLRATSVFFCIMYWENMPPLGIQWIDIDHLFFLVILVFIECILKRVKPLFVYLCTPLVIYLHIVYPLELYFSG